MDQLFDLFDYNPLPDLETTDLTDLPWFLEDLDRLDSGYSCGRIEEREWTPGPQAAEAGPAPTDVPANASSTSSASLPTTNTMPPQAVGALANHTEAGHGNESRSILSNDTPPTTITHNAAKRRLSDLGDLVDAKRARQLNENMDPRGQARQEIFGPHFLLPSGPNYFHPPMPLVPPSFYAALRDSGAIPLASTSTSQPLVDMYPYGPPTTVYPDHLGHPMLPITDTAHAMPAPIPHHTQGEKHKQQSGTAPRPGGAHMLTAPDGPRFEDSNDAARQRTIDAHRANDARTNHAEKITCLWKDANATEPCHQSFAGTKALLTHCAASHGVSGAKAKKEMTRCAWDDCTNGDITLGGLKRHLKEVHGRHGRVRRTKTQGGSGAA